jgi:hypothetical protein
MSDQKNEILIVPSSSAREGPEGSKGLLGGSPVPVRLNADQLKENLSTFLQSVNLMLSGTPKVMEPFKLDEIELSVEVNAEGNIQLIGGIKVGATGGITLKLKR